MGYKSIFEMLFEAEEERGHKGYRMTLNEDRADFNLPPEMKLPTKAQLDAGKPNNTGGPIQQNKQLRLPGSSTIQSAAYWPSKAYLIVSFKSGHTYSYTEVGPWTIQEWEKASSAGSWFYYNIRTSFKYQKVS